MTFSFRTPLGEDKTYPIERLHQIVPANGMLLLYIKDEFFPDIQDDFEGHFAVIFQIDDPKHTTGWPEKV